MIRPPEEKPKAIFQANGQSAPPRSWMTFLIGRPLATADAPHQTIGKFVGLAVFASDALSSSAYAIDEILIVLILAGTAAMTLSLPIALAIVVLLAILTISYEQTIHAYPGGGGAYIVARDNLGELPAQVAGAALLTDYILTVAVSISSGVAQLTSAFPQLYPWRVLIALALIAFMTVVNLRGVKESGRAFALPTYFFLGMVLLTIGIGVSRYFAGALGSVPPETVEVAHAGEPLHALTLFLILRAFAGGCTALTGVEAISNGITAFREPRSRNAGITLVWMSAIVAVNLVGLTFLANQVGVLPSHLETGFSQIGRVVYGRDNPMYLALLASTTLILIMAANTAYADFPRLAALQAGDGFLPRQLTYRGSRLVFSYGIVALAGVASLLIILFQAQTNALIPLYAIGVYLSFTLSQAGMARRWWRCGRLRPGEEIVQPGSTLRPEPGWHYKMIINSLGAIATAIVMLVFAVTKLAEGAWIVIILIPTLVFIFFQIHRHYTNLARCLSLETIGAPTRIARHRVIVPVAGVHRGTLEALNYARSLSNDVTAVHVSLDPQEAERIRRKWETWGDGVRLVILDSPYRLMVEPLLDYIEGIAAQCNTPNQKISIVVPSFVSPTWWHSLLHMQTAVLLRFALMFRRGIVIIDVPYQVG